MQTIGYLIRSIQLFVAIKGNFFLNKLQRRGIPQQLLDKCSHVTIWIFLPVIKIGIK